MPKWIGYKNGQFRGVYEGDSVTFTFGKDKNGKPREYIVTPETEDQVLFTIGCLRLKESKPKYPNRPYSIIGHGPRYEFVNDGKAEVVETYHYEYHGFQQVLKAKIDDWFIHKDYVLSYGIKWNGRRFDMRYRNIAHLSLLASLIPLGEYPENFEWFDADGNTFLLDAKDCTALLRTAAICIKNLEISFLEEYKHINSIIDIDELIAYQFKQRT